MNLDGISKIVRILLKNETSYIERWKRISGVIDLSAFQE